MHKQNKVLPNSMSVIKHPRVLRELVDVIAEPLSIIDGDHRKKSQDHQKGLQGTGATG